MATHRPDRRLALLTPVLAMTLTACSGSSPDKDATMHLKITASDSPDVAQVDATEGASTTLANTLIGDVEVEVDSVDGDAIEFTTSEDMAPEGKTGGINLSDTRSDFAVKQGQEVEFSTPTMDAGTTWTATLEDGPAPS